MLNNKHITCCYATVLSHRKMVVRSFKIDNLNTNCLRCYRLPALQLHFLLLLPSPEKQQTIIAISLAVAFAIGLVVMVWATYLIMKSMLKIPSKLTTPSEKETIGFLESHIFSFSLHLKAFWLRLFRKYSRAAQIYLILEEYEEALKYFIKSEAYQKAAEIYESFENYLEAAKMYELEAASAGSAEAFKKAAEAYIKAKKLEKAAEAYLKAGFKAKAAQLYVKNKMPEKAAFIYEEAKQFYISGKCYQLAERPQDAARVFEKAQHYSLAAQNYEQIGEIRKAAELYAKNFREKKYSSSLKYLDEERESAWKSGKLYASLEDFKNASLILEEAGFYAQSAEMLEHLQDYAAAAEAYLRSDDLLKAVYLYEKLGNSLKATQIRSEIFLREGKLQEAAKALEQCKDYSKAAELYREMSDFTKAAETFEKGAWFLQAGKCYYEAKEYGKAAENFLKADYISEAAQAYYQNFQYQKAAELFSKINDFYSAGCSYQKEGLIDEAIAALQKVDPQDPNYHNACSILGELFKEKGLLTLAAEKLQEALVNQHLSQYNLQPAYNLASIYEQKGELEKALELYEKILVEDYTYFDVAKKADVIRDSFQKAVAPQAYSAQNQKPILPVVRSQPTPDPAQKLATSAEKRYDILEELGRGGMGVVHKAYDNLLNRTVALKIFSTGQVMNAHTEKRLFKEARLAANLNHPNIITIYDIGKQDNQGYIAMEYIEGKDLKNLIKKNGKLPLPQVLSYLEQICEGLQYAHSKGVVHRDIKPSNIMLTMGKDNLVKILDFGLAKVTRESAITETPIGGTAAYMSPEQILSEKSDHRTDIYSLGISIFEMLTGKLPFSEGKLGYHHLYTKPPSLSTIEPYLPLNLNLIIQRCLEKDPKKRYSKISELLQDLRSIPI